MESLGNKLRETREGKGISFDQVGLDTKLAARYLQALEKEDFSKFPGETYITGSIKSYGAYLELDVNELLAMYHALKIQEQPIPVDQLLRKPFALPKVAIVAGIVIVVFGVAAAVFFLARGFTIGGRVAAAEGIAQAPRLPAEHIMSGDSFEHRFFQGDSLLLFPPLELPSEGYDWYYRLELLDVAGNEVIIGTPRGPIAVDLSRHASVDFYADGVFDRLRVTAIDFARNNPSMGAHLRFERYTAMSVVLEMHTVAAGGASVTSQSQSAVIFSSPNPHPFTLQADFTGGNMFRWEVLFEAARPGRNERFFQRLDELTIPNMHNGVRIWTSNAQSARFQVIGGGRVVPVEIGGPGEVVVADIRWVLGADNIFRLTLARLET